MGVRDDVMLSEMAMLLEAVLIYHGCAVPEMNKYRQVDPDPVENLIRNIVVFSSKLRNRHFTH